MLLVISALTDNLITLGVGALLTAVLGGVLAPWVKGYIDRRRERLDTSVELLDTLANDLWSYWKLALRIAYYGEKGAAGLDGYKDALTAWDSDESWKLGCSIQAQVSRARRLMPPKAHDTLQQTQDKVVTGFDREVDRLRAPAGSSDRALRATLERRRCDWCKLRATLEKEKRSDIEELLSTVVQSLKLDRKSRIRRLFDMR